MSKDIITDIKNKREALIEEAGIEPFYLICDKATYAEICLDHRAVVTHFGQAVLIVVLECEGGFEYVFNAPYQYLRLTTHENKHL